MLYIDAVWFGDTASRKLRFIRDKDNLLFCIPTEVRSEGVDWILKIECFKKGLKELMPMRIIQDLHTATRKKKFIKREGFAIESLAWNEHNKEIVAVYPQRANPGRFKVIVKIWEEEDAVKRFKELFPDKDFETMTEEIAKNPSIAEEIVMKWREKLLKET